MSGRPGSGRSGSYGHTDSEISGDEISASTESGKEDRRSARSPKPMSSSSSLKGEKDERNKETSRRDEKRGNEYPQSRNEKKMYDSNGLLLFLL